METQLCVPQVLDVIADADPAWAWRVAWATAAEAEAEADAAEETDEGPEQPQNVMDAAGLKIDIRLLESAAEFIESKIRLLRADLDPANPRHCLPDAMWEHLSVELRQLVERAHMADLADIGGVDDWLERFPLTGAPEPAGATASI